MARERPEGIVELGVGPEMWERTFTVSPLVVIGTREEDGSYDLAPKHMATPLGSEGYYGFVCTPSHATYRNARRTGEFTVSYPRPSQVVMTSLAAAPRPEPEGGKPVVDALPTWPGTEVDAPLLWDAHLFLECELRDVLDGFGEASLLAGRIVAAHADRRALRVSEEEDTARLEEDPLLAYVSPGRFARLARTHPFPFPAGFLR